MALIGVPGYDRDEIGYKGGDLTLEDCRVAADNVLLARIGIVVLDDN